MKKTQKFKVSVDFLEYDITVWWNIKDVEDFRDGEFIKRYPGMKRYGKSFYAMHVYDYHYYPRQSFLILPVGVELEVVVHEITHAVDAMTKFHGLEGTEVRAHLMEYLFKEIYKKLVSIKRQPKVKITYV